MARVPVTIPPLLLDTCATIWLMNGDKMSQASHKAIEASLAANSGVYVSPITAWEIGTLVAKQRIQLTLTVEAWFEALLSLPGVRLAPLTPQILIASTILPGSPPKDPADRIIAATAREHGLTIITRDNQLIPYGEAGYILTVAC